MYVYCMVCYCVIAAPICKKCCLSLHTITLDGNLECPMDYELSVLPNYQLEGKETKHTSTKIFFKNDCIWHK